ncbi:ABC transporter permease [Erwinia billingiae]|uniref:Putative ABC-type proline/glycine betaine transport systems, permease component, YehY n=1 Tax=Erwinia billingiae (strain Eb661) TaxID=634500 RepID=D8MQ08_ERWBE|nr:ABC transporter permease [Erwinia billingiae]CAX58915.1 Putative ABC-type proline/glycine betaine transport systems, permease component, YehY [Erwinia billingiae Eb661]
MRLQLHNRVLLTLAVLLAVAAASLPFLNYAPNRLVSGQPLPLHQLLQGVQWLLPVPVILLLLLAFLPVSRRHLVLTLLLSEGLFIALIAFSGHQATLLSQQGSPLARTSWGSGFWLSGGLCLLIAADTISRLTPQVFWRLLLNGQIWLPVIVFLLTGQLDQMALLKEYANRREVFDQAFSRHLLLLVGTLIPTLAIGIPLGWWCAKKAAVQSPVFAVLNVIQTVPSVALFGLLIAPLAGLARAFPWLSELGISGIGMAPALIALVLYALLPLVRSVVAGLQQVPKEVIETAEGMGMTRSQIFWQAEVPLALPVLLTGLRVIAVQTVGMAVIAALIGAGGFGAIIFQGLLSSALELVLLGVIPVIAMAVVIDALFKFVLSVIEAKRQ